jgi:CheY-like chemotaxis protein
MSKRILIVSEPDATEQLRNILGGYDLTVTSRFTRALKLVTANDFDLIVVSIHFEDGQALDFVSTLRAASVQVNTPVVLFGQSTFEFQAVTEHTIEALKPLYNISAFIQPNQYADELMPHISMRLVIDRLFKDEGAETAEESKPSKSRKQATA